MESTREKNLIPYPSSSLADAKSSVPDENSNLINTITTFGGKKQFF